MKKYILILMLSLSPIVAAQQTTTQERYSEEIAALRDEILELDSRLKEIEQLLKPNGITSDIRTRIIERSRAIESSSTNEQWHNASAWQQIRSGMSRQQVIAILGEPTRTDHSYFFYEGAVAGQGVVSGNVFFINNQVIVVSKPYFN